MSPFDRTRSLREHYSSPYSHPVYDENDHSSMTTLTAGHFEL